MLICPCIYHSYLALCVHDLKKGALTSSKIPIQSSDRAQAEPDSLLHNVGQSDKLKDGVIKAGAKKTRQYEKAGAS